MLRHGLYEQVINNAMTSELVDYSETRKAFVPIENAEVSKVLTSIWLVWFRRALIMSLINDGDLDSRIPEEFLKKTNKLVVSKREGGCTLCKKLYQKV